MLSLAAGKNLRFSKNPACVGNNFIGALYHYYYVQSQNKVPNWSISSELLACMLLAQPNARKRERIGDFKQDARTSSAAAVAEPLKEMKNFLRALNYFRPDFARIALVVVLLLVSIGLNVLKPWPLAVIVDSVLGQKPYPSWLPAKVTGWDQATQLTALISALLALHLGHALVSAAQLYLSIGVGLRGLCRVRNEVFG